MNILLISPYFSPAVGGVETHLSDLCKYLSSKKHTIYVRTYQALGSKERGKVNEVGPYLSIHRLPYPNFNLIFKLESYPQLKFSYIFLGLFLDCLFFMILNNKKIDVIQVHGFIAAAIGVLLAKIFNKKLVINTHVGFKFSQGGIMHNILTWTLLKADKILVLTSGAKKSLMKIGIPEDKIDIYHYWVDQNIFTEKRIGNKDPKKLNVLFVGRLIPVKGVRLILDLARKLTNINFVVAGAGPLEDEVEEKSKNTKNLIYLGKVSNNRLPDVYRNADILLIPSRIIKQEYEEGIPRVMIEALSCGVPVISTKSGGIPDIFSREIGMLVDDNLQSLIKAINKVDKDRKLLSKFQKNSRKFAVKNFSIKNARIIENSL